MEETLRSIYFNPLHPAAFGSISSLYQAARKVSPEITRSKVKNWLQEQDVYTLHAPIYRHFTRRKTIVPGLYYQMQADLADMSSLRKQNKGYKYILTALDVFNRKAFAVPLKSKRETEVKEAIAYIFTQYPKVRFFQTDGGTEFHNKTVKQYLKDNGMTLFTTSSDTKCALVERFNRSLKQRMFKYFTGHNTVKYIDILQKLVEAYNNRKHSALGIAPNQVTLTNQKAIWLRQYQQHLQRYRKATYNYDIGDTVRISKVSRQFRKGYLPGYQKEIFVIHDRMATFPSTYKLRDQEGEILIGSFYERELQKVRV